MRYWINRRARELSLRFMYSIDIDDQDSLDAIKNINLDIDNFWDSNPVVNYYMLKKMVIAEKEMVVVGCSLLKSGKVFLRVIKIDVFNKIISKATDSRNFKNFLKIYNANERIKSNDTNYYELLRDVFDNSKKIITKNIIKDKATEIINGCLKNIKPIDDQIDQTTKNWKLSRINSIDLNILRIAVYEILFSKGIPAPISIKEAIVLALKYSSDESCSFINGILDTISKRALQ